MDRQWIKSHADQEIDGGRVYFQKAQEATDPEIVKMFCHMAHQEFEHAGDLMEMLAKAE